VVENVRRLIEVSRRVRARLLLMASIEPSIHLGASLSVVDVLVALMLGRGLRRGLGLERDWLILSKGHAVPALYAVLAELGILDEDYLLRVRRIDGLEGHPLRGQPGIDVTTGSLGQGLSIAAGIAYAMKLEGLDRLYRVFVIMGDGELDEGQVWEAATTIAHLGLSNVIAIVDVNGYQLDGRTRDVKLKGNLVLRWSSVGWGVVECDGHDHEEILRAIEAAEASDRPTAILAYTVRGRGLGALEKSGGQHISSKYARLAAYKLVAGLQSPPSPP
jgi:transketolase